MEWSFGVEILPVPNRVALQVDQVVSIFEAVMVVVDSKTFAFEPLFPHCN